MPYIAHFRESDHAIHPLSDHLMQVAKRCEKHGSKIGVGKLAYLAGLLHDMGKYSQRFQDYIISKMPWNQQNQGNSIKVDHGRIGALYIYNKYHHLAGVLEKATAEILAMVICYHHGGLEDFITADLKIPLLIRFKSDPEDIDYHQCVDRFFEDVSLEEDIKALFAEACHEIDTMRKMFKAQCNPAGFFYHLLIKHIYSILIDSDRIDTYLFMENKSEEPLVNIKKIWDLFRTRLEEKVDSFKNKTVETEMERKIKDLRMNVSEACFNFAKRDKGVYLLTVPTGGGKTLSSLRFALEHAKKNNVERIVYVLPYTTIIEQNAQVVRETLQCDEFLLEHHANVIDSEHEKYKLLTQRWDCPIIYTTMVQFLNTFYKLGTSSMRRMHHLTNAILIFDEIQSLPIKCISLFNSTINYLSAVCGCTIILSSATQPNLDETDKRVILSDDPHMMKNYHELFSGFKRMNVVPRFIEGGYSAQMLKNLVFELSEKEKSILIILNTKQASEDVFRVLKETFCDGKTIYLLSTNLCPAHRKAIIKALREKLDAHEPVICVSTQLIEAGVDISFEAVVRSLSGLDSIAQASGRGNRHGEEGVKETLIVNMQNESLSKLPEIVLGQKYTKLLLHKFENDPEHFDFDLLSPKAILEYYKNYYEDGEVKKQMDYPVEKYNNLYNMLSGITLKKTAYRDSFGEKFPLEFLHMFRTAAEQFNVIEDNTRSVLVPHDRGREIITELIGNGSLSEKLKFLKEAQQYSVNLFEHQYRQLADSGALAPSPVEGITILKEGFYDETLGITYTQKLDAMTRWL